ncbi:MAG: AI-2E family transporter [Spirochaetes bacterium]|nr:AI-2E family transporter [Spirochaetota bacterium]
MEILLRKNRNQSNSLKNLFFFGLIILFFVLFYYFSSVVIPVLVPLIFAYLLSPVITEMEKKGIPRWLAILIVFLLIIAGFFLLIFKAIPLIAEELVNIKDYLPKLETEIVKWRHVLEKEIPFIPWQNINEDLSILLKGEGIIKSLVSSIPAILQNLISFIYLLVIMPFLLFFFLKDGRSIVKRCIDIVPNRYFEVFAFMVREIDVVLGRFLRGIVIQNSIIAILAISGLSIIGMKYALLIGLVIGITNIIPYMGPTMGFIIASLTIIIDPVGNPPLYMVIIVIAIVQLIDNTLVYPITIGKSVNLHPIAVISFLLLGGFLFGILGMLLAVPVFTSLMVITKTYFKGLKEYKV